MLSPENNKPSGGIKILYRHVDVLNRNSVDAMLLHQNPGFRCNWFENDTRVAYLQNTRLAQTDFLVIPEIYGPNISGMSQMPMIGSKVKKIIFNQNCRYTFLGQTTETVLKPDFGLAYTKRDEFVGAIVVSDDSKQYLEYVFPGLEVWRIHNAINVDKFSFSDNKKKQICFMPRKHAEDALQVLGILKLRDALGDFKVVAIENKNEGEVAEMMKESMFFLSFGYPEGCPLPPAEAMACGCVVVGYDGFGGREYFDPEFSYPIEIGDMIGFAKTIEKLIKLSVTEPAAINSKAEKASGFVRRTYSPSTEEDDILGIWNNLLHRTGCKG